MNFRRQLWTRNLQFHNSLMDHNKDIKFTIFERKTIESTRCFWLVQLWMLVLTEKI